MKTNSKEKENTADTSDVSAVVLEEQIPAEVKTKKEKKTVEKKPKPEVKPEEKPKTKKVKKVKKVAEKKVATDAHSTIRELPEYKRYFRKGIVIYNTETKEFKYYMFGNLIKNLNAGIVTMHKTRLTKSLKKGEMILNDNI
jgi:hypothetical protein